MIYVHLRKVKNWEKITPRKVINPLSAKPTKWSNTLKQFVDLTDVFAKLMSLELESNASSIHGII